jgi:hypothetical protein
VNGTVELGFLPQLGSVKGIHSITTIGGSLLLMGNDDLSLIEPIYNLEYKAFKRYVRNNRKMVAGLAVSG